MPLTRKIDEPEEPKFTHIDDFISYGRDITAPPAKNENYARWVFNYFRQSALCKEAFSPFMKDKLLFCDFEGQLYRVIGASRLGDVWLTKNFKKRHGYQKRVCVDDCDNWRKRA